MGKKARAAWADWHARRSPSAPAQPATAQGRVKGAKATEVEGIRFGSKLEADHYRELNLLQRAGQIVYFLRQVPFVVATGITYRLDFLVVWNRTGTPAECITYHETKGHMTDAARIKLAAVQDRYGIRIRVLKREDVMRFG